MAHRFDSPSPMVPIWFVATCGACGFAYEPVGRVDTDEIPVCRSCRERGHYAGECLRCHDYKVCNDDGKCFDCEWRHG